jgi:hypothetical protein
MYKKGCSKKILVYFIKLYECDILNDSEADEKRNKRDRSGRV